MVKHRPGRDALHRISLPAGVIAFAARWYLRYCGGPRYRLDKFSLEDPIQVGRSWPYGQRRSAATKATRNACASGVPTRW